MSIEDIKPCPICGCTAYIYTTLGRRNSFNWHKSLLEGFSVHCSKSCVLTLDYETKEEATKIWNERVEAKCG